MEELINIILEENRATDEFTKEREELLQFLDSVRTLSEEEKSYMSGYVHGVSDLYKIYRVRWENDPVLSEALEKAENIVKEF